MKGLIAMTGTTNSPRVFYLAFVGNLNSPQDGKGHQKQIILRKSLHKEVLKDICGSDLV